jgi:tetratricopeptide (TPR) repeat protein
MKEFMGVDRDFAKGPLVAQSAPVIVRDTIDGGARIVGEGRRVERVVSHPDAKLRAARFISTGDSEFSEQQYHAAAQRYREAAVAAPDVADAFFRQGFAYIASNRFDLAAKSFRRGLELDPLWVNSSFRLDDIYGRNQLAKGSHVEGLARAALTDRSADNLFLVGLLLHFDGQAERAKKFFTHAEKRTAGDDAHIQAFLVPPAPAAEDAV